jgi:hypothetical protein
MHIFSHRRLTTALAIMALLAAITFGLSLRPRNHPPTSSAPVAADVGSEQIDQLPDQPLRILENSDAPLRIMSAAVTEVSGPVFTRVTGQKTDLQTVCSVPEVKLLNSSAKTITEFVVVVRDPTSKTTRGIIQNKVSIGPGQTYTVDRQSFLRPEWTSAPDKDGKIDSRFGQPGKNSERYWLTFAQRADLFVTVAQVTFADRTNWTLKEGGDLR